MIIRIALLLFTIGCIFASGNAQPVEAERESALEHIRQGDSLIEARQYRQAEAAFSRALSYFEAEGDCYNQAYCYLWLSEASYGLRRPPAASMALAEKSKAIADSCHRRSDMAFYSIILQNLGVFSSQLGDFDRQMEFYRQSFQEVLRFEGRRSERGADAYQNLGVAFGSRGQWDKAIAYLDTSLQLSEVLNYEEGIAVACHNLAYAYETKQDFIRAIDFQRRSLRLSSDPEVIGRGHNNLGTYYGDLGEHVLALDHLEEALCIRDSLYAPADEDVLSTLLNIAGVYYDLERLEKADAYVDQVLERLERSGNPHPSFLKLAYHYKANFRRRDGRLAAAENYIRRALSIDRGDARQRASSLLILADVLGGRGRHDEALRHVQAALALEVDGFVPGALYDNPALARIPHFGRGLDLLRLKASLLHRRGVARSSEKDLSQSLTTYRLTDSLVTKARRRLPHNASKVSLAAAAHRLYAGAVAAGHAFYRLSGDPACLDFAFTYSEKSKAMLVLEKIHDLYAKRFHGIHPNLVEEEQRLLEDIEFYSNQLQYYRRYYPEEKALLREWEKTLFRLNRRQEELLDLFQRDFPEYYRLKHDLVSATPQRVQQSLLLKNEALLEYFAADSNLYIFLITPEVRDLIEVPLSEPVADLVQAFRRALIGQEPGFLAASHNLYRLLLAPVADRIAGRDLLIVPDGALGYLPFEALLCAPSPSDDHRRLPYLIRRHRLRYSLSASLALEQVAVERPSRPEDVLVMAPRFEGLEAVAAAGSEEFRRLRTQLSPLPGSRKEVDLIRQRFQGTFLQGEAARESFLKAAGNRYKIIHITTHTLIDERFPSLSKLVFADERGDAADGFLNVYELYNLPLNADLVVLSACNTGTGAIVKGEGIASLARAFAYAGSPNLVMSLWPVQDYVAPQLMSRFYDNLKAGMAKGEALHHAKLYCLDEGNDLFTHPYYWAAFVYAGDRAPVILQEPGMPGQLWRLLLILLPAMAILVFFLYRRQRKRVDARSA